TTTEVVPYQRSEAFEWRPGQVIPLVATDVRWSGTPNAWNTAPGGSYSLQVRQSFRRERGKPVESENEAIKRIAEEMKKAVSPYLVGTNHTDINGDGRKDALFWQCYPGLDPKTDIYLFL